MSAHISDDFRQHGGSYLLSSNAYEDYVQGKELIGRPDGQFICPLCGATMKPYTCHACAVGDVSDSQSNVHQFMYNAHVQTENHAAAWKRIKFCRVILKAQSKHK